MGSIRIKTALGTLEGEENESTMIFRGIPYAQAPIGSLRWKAPQPCQPWSGIRKATQFAAMAPQADMSKDPFYGKEFYTSPDFPLPEQSEDCLYLNIWAPKDRIEGGAPVAFWIHGGAFDHGFGSEMEFDGEDFASRGVILVTINYRVGALGFLALPELEDPETHTVGNYGLLDQVQALRWVHDNIAAFGGDPSRLTVFGQSAGAISTQALLSSPLTAGLIRRAILQSGGGYHNHLTSALTKKKALAIGQKFMELTGAASVEDLRKMEPQQFVKVLPGLYQACGGLAFRPVIDGWFLKEDLDEAIRSGHFAEIPVMVGSTSEDVTVARDRDAQEGPLYEGCINLAHIRKAPTYVYYFNHHLPGDDAGAFHSSELWYVFGTLKRCWRPMTSEDLLLSRKIVLLWTNFIKDGYPSEWGWPACNEDQKIPYVRYLQ